MRILILGVRSSPRSVCTKPCNILNIHIDQGLHAQKPSQAFLSLSALPKYTPPDEAFCVVNFAVFGV